MATNDDAYKGGKMMEAWRGANEIPGATIGDKVEHALFRNCHIDALRGLREALHRVDPAMGLRFWKLVSSTYVDGAADEKRAFVAEVKARTARPAPPPDVDPVPAPGSTAVVEPLTWRPTEDPLSDHYQRLYQIQRSDVPGQPTKIA